MGRDEAWRMHPPPPYGLDTQPFPLTHTHAGFHPLSWRPLRHKRLAWHKWLFGTQSRLGYAADVTQGRCGRGTWDAKTATSLSGFSHGPCGYHAEDRPAVRRLRQGVGENGRGQAEITSGETRGPSPLPHGHESTWPVSSPHGWVPSVSFFLAGCVVSLSLGAPQL